MATDLQTAAVKYAKILRRLGKKEILLDAESRAILQNISHKKSTGSATLPPAAQADRPAPAPRSFSPSVPRSASVAPLPVEVFAFDFTGNKEADFEALRKIVLPCTKCSHLVKFRHNVVFGVGNLDAQLMFVGEAPGEDEDLKGEPFVGKAGQLLTKMIEAMALKRSDVYIANVLKCRPDMPAGASGNRKPTPSEMLTCLPYLRTQIAIIKPKVIVTLGATAIEGLVTPGRTSMSSLRGKWQTFDGTPVMPTYHPAYLLRDQSIQKKRIVWEDLLAVMEKLALPITQKQRNYFLKAV